MACPGRGPVCLAAAAWPLLAVSRYSSAAGNCPPQVQAGADACITLTPRLARQRSRFPLLIRECSRRAAGTRRDGVTRPPLAKQVCRGVSGYLALALHTQTPDTRYQTPSGLPRSVRPSASPSTGLFAIVTAVSDLPIYIVHTSRAVVLPSVSQAPPATLQPRRGCAPGEGEGEDERRLHAGVYSIGMIPGARAPQGPFPAYRVLTLSWCWMRRVVLDECAPVARLSLPPSPNKLPRPPLHQGTSGFHLQTDTSLLFVSHACLLPRLRSSFFCGTVAAVAARLPWDLNTMPLVTRPVRCLAPPRVSRSLFRAHHRHH
ncbi:hypothetical protein B0T25DRAFT_322019 [Lasiosphaeria hispida]|uniref:Secreted protein n=1 Tax=Lasiosphaeria hispida TaxID=260671 RepID=A0AAJ0M9U4_9PEZI|nr:hypothetical protein B0T25DRAFT_322019 [Lasiosphaeria hispida]